MSYLVHAYVWSGVFLRLAAVACALGHGAAGVLPVSVAMVRGELLAFLH